MREHIVFMGTPEFAVPALKILARRVDRNDLLVVTQPDRPAGRGRRIQPPAVRLVAEELNLEVNQVQTLRDPGIRERLTAASPSLIVVAAFGLLLPRWVLQLPSHGCVNLHASLLPRFRGASPIPAAIATGDATTGISLMEMEAGLDTGGVFATMVEPILLQDTTASLTARLATGAGELLGQHLVELLQGTIEPVPQSGEIVETRKIVKAHGLIDWTADATRLDQHVRAMWPWPRAWTTSPDGTRIQVHAARPVEIDQGWPPGTVVHERGDVMVVAGRGALQLDRIQLPGKAAQAARAMVQHPAFTAGTMLGADAEFVEPAPWIVKKEG